MPSVPTCGMPLSVAVPFPLSVKVTLAGKAPTLVIVVTVGEPAAVTVKEPGLPIVKAVLSALVMVGASVTVSVKV